MNRNTVIAKVAHQDLIAEWDDIIRASNSAPLPELDAAYIWAHPNGPVRGESIEMLTLVYRHPSNRNDNRNTHWFLIEPATDSVRYFVDKSQMCGEVRPLTGICYTLWYNNIWTEVSRAPYVFAIQRTLSGVYVNMAEEKH